MKLLAIETATEACSAAIMVDGDVAERYAESPRQHAELILPMVEACAADLGVVLKDLDGVAFGCGPGSFTGVRIAAGVTQGLAFGLTLPVIAVSTLQASAQGAHRVFGCGDVAVAFDARMGEVYWGTFRVGDDNLMMASSDEAVTAPEDVVASADVDWCGVGGGWESYGDVLLSRINVEANHLHTTWHPHARDVAAIAAPRLRRGEGVPAAEALPVYLRDRVTARRSS